MIRLEKLIIRKLGNIAPNTELSFSARGALLLGKNGTGKTTLLNVIVDALQCNWNHLDWIAKDGFEIAYAMTISAPHAAGPRLEVEVEMKSPSPPAGAGINRLFTHNLNNDHQLGITIHSEERKSSTHFATRNNITEARYEDGSTKRLETPIHHPAQAIDSCEKDERLLLPGAGNLGEELRSQVELLRRYDEANHYFDELTDDSRQSRIIASVLFPEGKPSEAQLLSSLYSEATCRAFLQSFTAAGDTPDNLRIDVAPSPRDDSTEAPSWVKDFNNLNEMTSSHLSLGLINSFTALDTSVAEYGAMLFRYVLHGNTLSDHQLSFGQKRLFSLLHYLDANKSIAVADELVNGLHHKWIEHCVEILRERQAFLSSQNPILFDFMDFESAEDAASRFIECSTDEQGRFVWRNMSLADGTEFYELYKTGIQQVSEILWTRGFW